MKRANKIILWGVLVLAILFGLGYLYYLVDELVLWYDQVPEFPTLNITQAAALQTCTETYQPIQSSTRALWEIRQRGKKCIMNVNFFDEYEKEQWTWYEVMEKYRCKVTPEFIENVNTTNHDFIDENCWRIKNKR
ncbi:hypothetical protein HN592_01005 [Candidatus Woesearchaeota archaeon]|jgi:hypothetical protein|nr:hypothetical protein [Candidatus Woesearchaeota archaeon]MBT4368883.1 hypothetical protein [Candidatus Woesearchaeota archaeon]MBT4712172.1 hypothetical protein [Candidatus Woesearchaeota archaeon]MBT6639080.1 hypothetical protein [Candidatus Woesearchaeota archaeon]MBT7134280.1 hypothetical protein [Candidatus Woesearchaeota archaeon]